MAAAPGAKLTDEVRRYIVACLARYGTPQAIADSVKELYGVEVQRQAVAYYDLDHNPELPAKWADLYRKCREVYLSAMSSEALGTIQGQLAALNRQLRYLDRIASKAAEENQGVVVMSCAEQSVKVVREAAKIAGGYYFRARPAGDTASPSPEAIGEITTVEDAQRLLRLMGVN